MYRFNTLRPRQNGRHFTDDIFKCILLNENVWIPIKISLKFAPKGPVKNSPALVQIMAWRRPDDKPLSESMTVILPTHICVTRPHWINTSLSLIWCDNDMQFKTQQWFITSHSRGALYAHIHIHTHTHINIYMMSCTCFPHYRPFVKVILR